MENVINFFSFEDPNVRYVVLGTVLLSASAAMVGSFILLQKKALIGDAVAHSVLPGICAAFLFSGTKDIVWMLFGAFITGWLALVGIDFVTKYSKIKKDAAIGLVLSVFFGVGIVLMTYIQQSGNAAQSGLDNFIFGKAAALIADDLLIFSILAMIILITISLFFKTFTLIAFDRPFAEAIGYPVHRLDLLLTSLTVLAVVTGITAVGVVLMTTMLITPPAAARYWTDNIRHMVLISVLFGAFAGLSAAFVSYIAPAMSTGPWMVVASSGIAFFSFFLAPKRGMLPKLYRQHANRQVIAEENLLKRFYHLGEARSDFTGSHVEHTLIGPDNFGSTKSRSVLRRLRRKGWVTGHDKRWQLTDEGHAKAAKVVRLHRLWELYLTKYMAIAADHVHDDAETIEHILTPELERELEQQLGYPDRDPHDTVIPKV